MCSFPDIVRLDIERFPHQVDDGASPNQLAAADYPFLVMRGDLLGIVDVRTPSWTHAPALMVATSVGVNQVFFSSTSQEEPVVEFYRSGDEILARYLDPIRIPGAELIGDSREEHGGTMGGWFVVRDHPTGIAYVGTVNGIVYWSLDSRAPPQLAQALLRADGPSLVAWVQRSPTGEPTWMARHVTSAWGDGPTAVDEQVELPITGVPAGQSGLVRRDGELRFSFVGLLPDGGAAVFEVAFSAHSRIVHQWALPTGALRVARTAWVQDFEPAPGAKVRRPKPIWVALTESGESLEGTLDEGSPTARVLERCQTGIQVPGSPFLMRNGVVARQDKAGGPLEPSACANDGEVPAAVKAEFGPR